MLLAQLSANRKDISRATLAKVASDPHVEVWVIRDPQRIVGTASLIVTPLFSGAMGEVHDVVVDASYRGCGLGTLLVEKLIERARARKCRHIDLTSRPSREAANALYRKLGFEKRDTNMYRLSLK